MSKEVEVEKGVDISRILFKGLARITRADFNVEGNDELVSAASSFLFPLTSDYF